MTIDTLNKANSIKKTIDKLECETSTLSKLFSKKESLTEEELKELFLIAMTNTSYTLKKFKEELDSL